jgi:hypothetical protein
MSGALLLLSFHTGSLMREDLKFKKACMDKHGLGAALVTRDIVADNAPPGPSLRAVDAAGGLALEEHDGVRAWSLGKLKAATWRRKGYRASVAGNSDFKVWLDSVLAHPAEVLLIGGHHGAIQGGGAMFWGTEYTAANGDHYPQSGFAIRLQGTKSIFRITAFRRADDEEVVTTDFDASRAVSACKLLIILGCNGTPNAEAWQSWVQGGRAADTRPLVLGWYGTHAMPKQTDPNFSPLFWQEVYAAAKTAGSTSLTDLIRRDPEAVVKAWGKALKATYKGHGLRSDLWVGKGWKKGTGAGAVMPNGKVWQATKVDGDIEPAP